MIRDVLPPAGHLESELRLRLRSAVMQLWLGGARIVDLVGDLGIPRVTVDSWIAKHRRSESLSVSNPVGIAKVTQEGLARVRKVLPVSEILAGVDEQIQPLDALDAAALLVPLVEEAVDLVAGLRVVRKRNGEARLAEGVRRRVVIKDLGVSNATVHEWALSVAVPTYGADGTWRFREPWMEG